jgi:hypothetical protein
VEAEAEYLTAVMVVTNQIIVGAEAAQAALDKKALQLVMAVMVV